MRADAIIFDLDGTLVDSFPGIEYSCRIAMRQVLPDRQFNDLRQWIGPPVRLIFRKKFDDIDDATLERLHLAFRRTYDDIGWTKTLAYDGVASTLARLSDLGLKKFVVTNKPSVPTKRILEHLLLTGFFTNILTPDSKYPPFKSKPEAVSRLIAEHSLDPRRTWLIGDSEDDARAAQASGLAFVAVAFGYGQVWKNLPQHRVLTRFDMLLELPELMNDDK